MAKKKESKTKSKKKEYLYIQLKTPMPEIMDQYCKETGLSPQDIGFQMGFIAGAGDELALPMVSLNQLFFYAGMFHALKHRGKYVYEYRDEKILTEVDKLKAKLQKNMTSPSYMG